MILLLGLALLLSLALNLLLARRGRGYERLFNMTRLDPLGAMVYDANAELPDDVRRVVFFGDSRARQWPAPPLPPGVTVINRGIDGHTAVQSRLRFEAQIRPLLPDVVVVQVGVNDLIGIDYLPAERDAIVANCRVSIAAIVEAVRAADATVVLTTIFPPGRPLSWERALGFAEVEAAIREVNGWMAGLADGQVVVLDTAVVLGDAEGRVRDAYRDDTWHLNPDGYAALNGALGPLLSEILGGNP